MPNLLSTTETAELIGVERSTLTRWVQTGRITEAYKTPGRNGVRLFDRSEVERVRSAFTRNNRSAA